MTNIISPPIPSSSVLISTPSRRILPRLRTSAASASSTSAAAIIVGGGLAGLAAAAHLQSANLPFVLLESSDGVGGRVRTDTVDGFLLDRGFQILLTAYPEARRLLNFPSLDLRPFYPGALVFHSGRLHRVADPFRRPLDALSSLLNPIGSPTDKLLVGIHRLRAAVTPLSAPTILSSVPETSISHHLRALGFSPTIINRFFRPFLAGIFFDSDLSTTSRLFDFVFQCLAAGDNVLPARGIGAIPDQLASILPPSSIRLNSKVVSVIAGESPAVVIVGGEVVSADLGVIVAVDQPEAERLLPHYMNGSSRKPPRSTVCLYFAADRAAVREPVLMLNGSGVGIVNNMCFPTSVAPSYGPASRPALVSVSLVGDGDGRSDENLAAQVVRELAGWFGPEEVGSWRLLRTYRIRFAQPEQTPPTELTGKEARVADRVYVCGDHWSSATFDGALVSGRRAAEALIRRNYCVRAAQHVIFSVASCRATRCMRVPHSALPTNGEVFLRRLLLCLAGYR
ncbi:Polyamine oxidase 3 [Apostasia shenzhenica]|uniref:Polyamine oxidase 3 n=1 Tax=Apostasia shenzhenica TaxID=1088818 RepID=A0A2I0A6Y0_9ASPA|nr:Polyamine oxidase 3 [Apostasia shenzhenica]